MPQLARSTYYIYIRERFLIGKSLVRNMGIFFWRKKEENVPEEKVKVKDDLNAALAFLKEMQVKELVMKLEKMREMVKEEGVVGEDLKKENLETQLKIFDEILQKYNFFQNDADINGERLKKIGRELLQKAEATGIDVKTKKESLNWRV